jgi:hypothetical protein
MLGRPRIGSAVAFVVAALGLLVVGCGGSSGGDSVSIEETKACFEGQGYTTNDRPDLGLADVSAEDWYEVLRDDEDVVVVAFFGDSGDAERSKNFLEGITRTASEAFGTELSESDVDELIRTKGNAMYWWNGVNPIHEDDVESCMNP